jgi:hypothetical protein
VKTRLCALALLVRNSLMVRSGPLRVRDGNLRRVPASSVRTRLKSEAAARLPDKRRTSPEPNLKHRPANIINAPQPKPSP